MPVRIATWNVNSVKQRVPRLLPWLDERQPDVVCLQETKLADDAFAELLGDELAAARLRGRRARRGGLERRGDPLARRARGRRRRASPGAPGLPAPGGARGVGDVRRHPRRLGLRAQRARAGLRPLPRTSSPGWPRCATLVAAGPEATVVLRRHEHRADRRRRLRPRRLRRPDARHAARARGAGRAAGARPARRRARPLAGRARVHLLGLPRRHVPPGPRDADRPRAGRRRRSPSACGRRGSTARRARARGRATTRR